MDKNAFFPLSYGVYIITSKYEENFSGCVVNTVCQITAEDKPKLTVAVNKENYTTELMQKSKKVNIAVLAQDAEFLLIGKFGFRTGRDYNKLEDTMYITGENGIPIITESAVSYIECNVLQEIDCSSHILFVLEAQEASVLNNKPALTYDYYHKVLKGKTPPKASSYSR